MMQKRGWMRIMESFIAVLILASIMVIIYIDSPAKNTDSKFVLELESRILQNISLNDGLRNDVLANNTANIKEFVASKIPIQFNYDAIICDIEKNCKVEIVT